MKKPGRLACAGIGMALMYFFDPKLGRARRERVRRGFACIAAGARDLRDQIVGLGSTLRAGLRRERAAEEVCIEAELQVETERCDSPCDTPAARMVVGALGAAMMLRFLKRPSLSGLAWGGLGLAMCLDAVCRPREDVSDGGEEPAQ